MGFKSDIEIAQECEMLPITQIAEKAGIDDKYLEQYGKYKAKIDYNLLKESDKKDGKLILVTAINPTPAGEGKTTTTVGLADAMQKMGKKVMVALREPSLGPVFGVKGMVAIRDTVRELIAMQMEEFVTDEEIQKQRKKLNQVYDTYTAKYGVIGSNANKRAFSDDSSYCLDRKSTRLNSSH